MTKERTHKFTSGDGTVREYLVVLDDENCPTCNPMGMRENGVMGVLSHVDGTTVLECLNCAHTTYRDGREIDFLYPQVTKAAADQRAKDLER